jgi:hypothetical protein
LYYTSSLEKNYLEPEKKESGIERRMAANRPDFELPLSSYGTNGENGRISLSVRTSAGGSAPSEFKGYQYETTSEQNFETDMIRGNWETTPVSKLFFSRENIQTIQNSIRKTVFEKSQPKGYVIDDQSVDELKMIMRAMYYQYARNATFDVAGQVTELDQRVVDWSVPHILSAVDHYHYYLQDISHMPVPLSQSVNLSRAGTKSLPQNPYM